MKMCKPAYVLIRVSRSKLVPEGVTNRFSQQDHEPELTDYSELFSIIRMT